MSKIYTGNSINENVKKTKYFNVSDGLCYIATKDIGFDNTIDYENGVKIPFNEMSNFKIAQKNSILLCIEGGSAGRKIGIIEQDVCFVNKLCCLYSENENSKYLYYYLQSDLFKGVFNKDKIGLIGGVSVKKLYELPIPLPPLPEQHRIVARIEQIFARLDEIGAALTTK